VEQRGLRRHQARVYLVFGTLSSAWSKHVRTGQEVVRRAFDTANRTGDLIYAGYCCITLNTILLATGGSLAEVQREAETGFEFATSIRFVFVKDAIAAQLGLIRTLRGLTPKFGVFNDDRFDEFRF
jgi:hypothetical protein